MQEAMKLKGTPTGITPTRKKMEQHHEADSTNTKELQRAPQEATPTNYSLGLRPIAIQKKQPTGRSKQKASIRTHKNTHTDKRLLMKFRASRNKEGAASKKVTKGEE